MLDTPMPDSVIKGMIAGDRTYGGPFFVEISPVGYCNFDCIQCHQKHHIKNDALPGSASKILPIERLKIFINEISGMGTKEIYICGRGEPTLYPQLAELVKTIKSHGIYCTLVTNGALLTPELADNLVKYGLDCMTISMYAGTEAGFKKITRSTHFSLRDIIANITYFRDACHNKSKLRVVWLLQKDNIDEFEEIISLVRRFGLREQYFFPIMPYSDGKALPYGPDSPEVKSFITRFGERLKRISDKKALLAAYPTLASFKQTVIDYADTIRCCYKKCPCYAGWWAAFLADDGTVRPCSNSNLILGQIFSSSMQEIWNSEKYNDFRRMALCQIKKTRAPLPDSYCAHCGWYQINLDMHNMRIDRSHILLKELNRFSNFVVKKLRNLIYV